MKKIRTLTFLLLIFCFVFPIFSLPLVSAVVDSWETLEPMPSARIELGVAVVDGNIYAIGGYNDNTPDEHLDINEMFDPATNTWTEKTPMPTARSGLGLAVISNKIYAIGGMTNTRIYNITEVYDTQTDIWENRAPFQTIRELPVVNAVDGKIYVMGGFIHKGALLTTYGVDITEIYDPATDTWTTGAPMPNFNSPRSSQTLPSAVVDDKIYVIIENTTHVYDTKTDTWSYGAPFPTIFYRGAAGATMGEFAPKRIYVVGGLFSGSGDINNQTYIYDPETDTWTTGAPILTPRYRLSIAVVEDKLYALGGYDGTKYYSNTEVYTPLDYIPEFSSWALILFVFAILSVVVTIFKRKLLKI